MKNYSTNNNEITPELKYRLKDLLQSFSKGEYSSKIEELSKWLGVTSKTIYNWSNIALISETEIPEGKMQLLATYFNLASPAQLRNYEPTFNK